MTKLRRYLVFSPKLDEHSLPKVTVFSGKLVKGHYRILLIILWKKKKIITENPIKWRPHNK